MVTQTPSGQSVWCVGGSEGHSHTHVANGTQAPADVKKRYSDGHWTDLEVAPTESHTQYLVLSQLFLQYWEASISVLHPGRPLPSLAGGQYVVGIICVVVRAVVSLLGQVQYHVYQMTHSPADSRNKYSVSHLFFWAVAPRELQ